MRVRVPSAVTIALVRAWVVTLLASVLVVMGLVEGNAQMVFLGFGALGVEPLLQARKEANGG